MALFYYITMAVVLTSAYCKANSVEHLKNFARSDTFAVCTMNYFGPSSRSAAGRGAYNTVNNIYNPSGSSSSSNSGNNAGPIGNGQVGENTYGDATTNEQDNEDNDFIQCAQQAWQTYNENNNKTESNNSGWNSYDNSNNYGSSSNNYNTYGKR